VPASAGRNPITEASPPARTHRERPSGRRTAKQRDEIAPLQLIELHSIPASQGQVVG
jgi:hypothetical protein